MTKSMIMYIFFCSLLVLYVSSVTAKDKASIPRVVLKTTMGEIELELYPEKAPISVENFLNYVNSGFYNDLVFHRVIRGFMIQGGGYDKDLNRKETESEDRRGIRASR